MSDDPRTDSVVFSAGAGKLDDATIKRLKDEFGLELKVRASSVAVDNVLKGIGEAGIVYFDKTYPGYDKVFDKTSPGAIESIDVVNPVDLKNRISDIETRIGRMAGPK